MRPLLIGLVTTLMCAQPVLAENCTAIVGGIAYLPQGKTPGVNIIVKGQKIVAAAQNAAVPKGCKTIEAKGAIVTPGLVEVHSQLGLVEVDLEEATVDFKPPHTEHGKYGPGGGASKLASVHSSFQVGRAYNPRSTLIPIARVAGVTSSIVAPQGGVISGQAAWVDLSGGSQAATVKRLSVAMHSTLRNSATSRAALLHALERVFEDSKVFTARRADWEKAQSRPFSASALDLAALQPVLKGTLPLVISVHRAADIEAVIALVDKYKIKVVIEGGAEAWMLAKALAKRKIAVVTNPVDYLPNGFDRVHTRPDNAAVLVKAGVPVMFSTFWTHNVRTLAQVAGNAVRAGLPHSAAIKALTQTPAEVFGMTGYGRLAKGAVANIVVWSGDPLELSGSPKTLLIGGRNVPLVTRHSLLRDRYLKHYTPQPLPLP